MTEEVVDPVVYHNPPALTSVYIDPETLVEHVIVVAGMFGGSKDHAVTVAEDGRSATITSTWGEHSYNMEALFKHRIAAKEIEPCHPKVVALSADAQSADKPKCAMVVSLPIRVATDPTSWEHWGVESKDGCITVVADFKGVQPRNQTSSSSKVQFKKV